MDTTKTLQQQLERFMPNAARPSGGMGLSNPRRWRGKRLCHHGDGVWKVVCALCAVSQLVTRQSGSFYVKNVWQLLNLRHTLMSMNRLITNYGTVYSSNG
jgi:hypothetical protein